MTNPHLYAVVMAGGGGTRLWPLSRRTHPKQMLKLFGDRTMFQLSVERLLPLLPPEQIFVVTAAAQVEPLIAQCPNLPRENFIVEPLGRGTAACIGLSALHLHRRDSEAVMAVTTADHFIRREDVFRDTLVAAQTVAEQGYLVTLGIEPHFPAMGYGYISQGEWLGIVDGVEYFQMERFTEKPDIATALRFLQEGTYAWNSGMFIWKTARILEEIARLMPDLDSTLHTLAVAWDTDTYTATLQKLWPKLYKQTIDYGIMEKAEQVAVIPVDLGWSDIGAWAAVLAMHQPDELGNVLLGDVISVDTQNTMVFSNGKRLISTIGVRDLIIVDTPDAILITHRDQSQHVREIVTHLRTEGRDDKL